MGGALTTFVFLGHLFSRSGTPPCKHLRKRLSLHIAVGCVLRASSMSIQGKEIIKKRRTKCSSSLTRTESGEKFHRDSAPAAQTCPRAVQGIHRMLHTPSLAASVEYRPTHNNNE